MAINFEYQTKNSVLRLISGDDGKKITIFISMEFQINSISFYRKGGECDDSILIDIMVLFLSSEVLEDFLMCMYHHKVFAQHLIKH
jgi:hypothetical protein